MKYENPKNTFEEEINKIEDRISKSQHIMFMKKEVACLRNIYNSLSDEQKDLNHCYVMTIFNKL